MKRAFKTISSLALMLIMLMSLATTAFAVSPSITFRGFSHGFDFKPGSEFTETDLFNSFKGVMPGDVLTETITFTNDATDCDFVNLYMRAETHDETANPLHDKVAETETVATMTEFLSQLSMKVWNGTELIYEASPNELDGLKENVFLGTFRTGQTGSLKVELTVPLDLDNRFANRVGEVDWVFHVEAWNESQIAVRKVWSDGNANHADDSITVHLLKDGKVETSAVLNAENGWAYTFDRLLEGHDWSVEEAEVPEGYHVQYLTEDGELIILNSKDAPAPDPGQPLDIVVKKVWSNDKAKERPASVTVTLYNGKTAYDTVKLSAENNWTYHWKDLDVYGNWQVTETNIPKGYTPSYRVAGNVITITNTRKLIQTGQMNWPIMVLGGAGLALVALGGAMVLTKKKRENA